LIADDRLGEERKPMSDDSRQAKLAREPYRYTFTVFTATYDRAHTLRRVYESLRNQTFKDFEWLIVDDGSADGTRELVAGWAAEEALPIRYFSQSNEGKHVAFNRAVMLARGELFLTLDSDDACVPIALERFKYYWDGIPAGDRHMFCSVTALCVDQDGQLVGTPYPTDILDANPVELLYRYGIVGEKWGFTRTDVLKQFPFPTPNGMTFVPESIVWDKIGIRYRTRYVNERLRIYWLRRDLDAGRPRSLTSLRKHAAGLTMWHAFILNNHLRLFRNAPMRFVVSAVDYSRFSALAGRGPLRQLRGLRSWPARVIWALAAPIGYSLFVRDLLRGGRSGPMPSGSDLKRGGGVGT
jgi:glycosyltransferase involved in cell wall biosynthesis